MGNALVGGIYVVRATKADRTEYWAAATVRDGAAAAVARQLPADWTVTLTDRRLTMQRIRSLKMAKHRMSADEVTKRLCRLSDLQCLALMQNAA
jgi:hypothetical protein